MQLVLHAPFGSRINKAWGLALRKRFCRQFNFELQAAATEDALLLSLGPQHSFPLADVFRYLHPETTRDVLVQAFLDAPVFQTRWRWNTTISLAVPRSRGGRKVAPQLQRMLADDLMAAVFPDAAACLENIPGDRADSRSPAGQPDGARLPRGGDGLRRPARACSSGSTAASCGWSRATRRSRRSSRTRSSTPSRTRSWTMRRSRSGAAHAVQTRRAGRPASAGDLGALDAGGDRAGARRSASRSARRRRAARRAADGGLPDRRRAGRRATGRCWHGSSRRAAPAPSRSRRRRPAATSIAAERLPELLADPSGARRCHPALQPPASRLARAWTRDDGDRRAAARPADASPGRSPRRRWPIARHRGRRRGRGAARARGRGRRCLRGPLHARATTRARMVRPRAARAHPSLHAEPAARRDRAGQPGRLHALPVRVAARRTVRRG